MQPLVDPSIYHSIVNSSDLHGLLLLNGKLVIPVKSYLMDPLAIHFEDGFTLELVKPSSA